MSTLNSEDSEESKYLKRIIAVQQREIKEKNERLKGLEDLTRICSEWEEKQQSWKTQAENYQTTLRYAEAKIAALNKKLGIIGPQTAFEIDVINPVVSRKEFDAITRENIQLREALEHIVPIELGGEEVVLKNQELYEMVTKLQEEITRCNNHIRELEEALASSENDLALKVNDLTKRNKEMEIIMNTKQVFSEKLMKENKSLNNRLEQIRIQEIVKERDVPDGQASGNDMNAQKIERESRNIRNEERERMQKMIDEMGEKMKELAAEIDKESKQVQNLTNELGRANKIKEKLESDLSESEKRGSDFQSKCNSFFKESIRLHLEIRHSEEEISQLKRAIGRLRDMVSHKDAAMDIMRDMCKTDDKHFRRAIEKQGRIQEQLNQSNQLLSYLKQELSQLASSNSQDSIQHLNNNNLTATVAGRTSPNEWLMQSRQDDGRITHEYESVPDLNSADIHDESYDRKQADQANDVATMSPTFIECHYCTRNFPIDLIEQHLIDCREEYEMSD